jgi:hypothetical protein
MTTHFIEAEMDWNESTTALQQEIVAELERRGEVLRWAITEVNSTSRNVTLEAVVTTGDLSHTSHE